jgi:arsenite methyltransferase
LVVLDTDWDTLVWKSDDRELMERVMQEYQAVYADAHLPRTMPSRLRRAGFSKIEMESFVVLNTSFGADTYARQSAEFATSIMDSSPDFTLEEQTAWLDHQEELARTDDFFFSLNRYLLAAHK